MNKYVLAEGSVQPIVVRENPFFMHHFGRAQYARELPILTDSIRKKAQPIVDKLNKRQLTQKQAVKLLDQIWI